MKTIFSAYDGAITLIEDKGIFTLSFNESIGGGKSAGIIKGVGSLVLDAETALKLGEAAIIAHLPPAVQALGQAISGVVNSAIDSLE